MKIDDDAEAMSAIQSWYDELANEKLAETKRLLSDLGATDAELKDALAWYAGLIAEGRIKLLEQFRAFSKGPALTVH